MSKEAIAYCEACGRDIFEGEAYHSGLDTAECEECAPTWQLMLDEPEFFADMLTSEPLTPEQARERYDAHIAAGGKPADKMVWR